MNKRNTIILISSALLFIPLAFVFAATPLEIIYPSIGKIKPTSFLSYVNYVLIFSISAGAILAVLILVISGMQYAASSGKPGEMEEAKKRIFSALLGLAILFSSYIILGTINPQLLNISFTPSKIVPKIYQTATLPSVTSASGNPLERIKKMSEDIKGTFNEIQSISNEIKTLTSSCNCDRTRSVCMCNGGNAKSSCEPKTCYAGTGDQSDYNLCGGLLPIASHPCADINSIKTLQKNIIDRKDLALYYRTLGLEEIKNIQKEIEIVVNAKIAYFQEQIKNDKNNTKLKQELETSIIEKQSRESIINQIRYLSDRIPQITTPTSALSQLPNQCLSNVPSFCKPKCLEGNSYGCHDKICGCQPDKCYGGNPCPVDEIGNRTNQANSVSSEVIKYCDAIINIINNMPK